MCLSMMCPKKSQKNRYALVGQVLQPDASPSCSSERAPDVRDRTTSRVPAGDPRLVRKYLSRRHMYFLAVLAPSFRRSEHNRRVVHTRNSARHTSRVRPPTRAQTTSVAPWYNLKYTCAFVVILQVPYGDLAAEAGTMTTFLCPELTMRQLKRLPPPRGLAPESTGRVVPALKDLGPCNHAYKRMCPQTALDHAPYEGELWKQEPGALRFFSSRRPLCRVPPAPAGGTCASGGTGDLLKFPTTGRPDIRT